MYQKFVTFQYQLNISPKIGLMERSVVSIIYMGIFDDICNRYCNYSTQNRVSVYSYTAIGHIQTLYMTRRWIPHPYLIRYGWCWQNLKYALDMPCIWNTDVCRYDQRSFTEPIHDNIKLQLVSVKTIYCLQDVYWVHILTKYGAYQQN